MSTIDNIRNFDISAHIDHGKSTIADRIIHNRGIYFKKMLDLKQKSLILFDHFFEKFYKIFYHKLPNPHPNLAIVQMQIHYA